MLLKFCLLSHLLMYRAGTGRWRSGQNKSVGCKWRRLSSDVFWSRIRLDGKNWFSNSVTRKNSRYKARVRSSVKKTEASNNVNDLHSCELESQICDKFPCVCSYHCIRYTSCHAMQIIILTISHFVVWLHSRHLCVSHYTVMISVSRRYRLWCQIFI